MYRRPSVMTRRSVLGLLGRALPFTGAAQSRKHPLSALVSVDDSHVEVLENLWIPMADGTRLAARLFLPRSATRVPVGAVLEYLPYRKRDGYRYRDDVAGPFLAKSGIALLRVDIRGTGDSDGTMIDEYLPIEQADALAVIDWIAHQPWCNGSVGMRGISYGSFTALQAASKAPPALKAIVSTCGTEQRYLDDIHYRGGCLIADQLVWAMEWGVHISGDVGSRTYSLIEGSLEPEGAPIAGIDTLYKEAYRLRRSIREDDPNSAEWEAEAINIYERGDWRVRLRARSVCRSTATHFICVETFEAWTGDKLIFSRAWDRQIARQLV